MKTRNHWKTALLFILSGGLLAGCAQTPEQSIVREKGGQSLENYKEVTEEADPGADGTASAGTDSADGQAGDAAAGNGADGTAAGNGVDDQADDSATGNGVDDQADDAATGNGVDSQVSDAAAGTSAEGQAEDAANGISTEGKGENSADGISGTAGNQLAARLNVPEIYTASQASQDGIFELTCNAVVEVPDVSAISVYAVGQRPCDQEWIDTVTKAFFGDQPVYDGAKYFVETKEQILENLNELKKYQAEGNLDPYGIIADQEKYGGEDIPAEQLFDLQALIDSREEDYADAPDGPVKEEVTPGLSSGSDGAVEIADGFGSGYFDGAVEMEDGSIYHYQMLTAAPDHMNITIHRYDPQEGVAGLSPWWWYFTEEDTMATREELESMAGISAEEARKVADSYVEKLGLTDFSAKTVEIAKNMLQDRGGNSYLADAGYLVTYTRDLNGFPVTREDNQGGAIESMESTTEPWGYEGLEIVVNQEGLQNVSIRNLYEVGEQRVANVELLSFPEVASIFEKMVVLRNSDMGNSTTKCRMMISRVTLGYMRIYDPGADNTSGVLVPVWDFFGEEEVQYEFEGEAGSFTNSSPHNSYLTVNAVDGTVIDRSLGY